jgi:hypothetical protein
MVGFNFRRRERPQRRFFMKKGKFLMAGMVALSFGLVLAGCASTGTIVATEAEARGNPNAVVDPDRLILGRFDTDDGRSDDWRLVGTWSGQSQAGVPVFYTFSSNRKVDVTLTSSNGANMVHGDYKFDGSTLHFRVNGALATASASVSGNTFTVSDFTGAGARNAGLSSYEGTFTRQ